jgi:hypothetical protein
LEIFSFFRTFAGEIKNTKVYIISKIVKTKNCKMSNLNLTGAEKVIWKSTYDFSINTLKMSEEAAKVAADKKIMSVRALKIQRGIIKM